MPELLLEILSEEIPARMQARAEADLKQAVLDGLKAAGVSGDKAAAMSGPRRLAVVVEGLPAKSDDVREERKGPKVGAPEKALAGFLRGAGLARIDEAEIRSDPKKGEFYVAVIENPGRKTADIIAELVPEIIRGFHWPKSMRWGSDDLRWVRPIQRILCVFDGKVVPFEIAGIKSGDLTEGHRVHGRGPYKVRSFDDYVSALGGEGHVLLTREDRKALIDKGARAVCKKAGLELVEDQGLLEEVTGLAEWPVVIMGDMDPDFLSLPPEVIRLSMRTHQKYFSVRDPKTGSLAPKFITVANIEASDGGKTIAEGNAKVLSARLDDARFFWENDKKTPMEDMAAKLGGVAFKEELGSIGDKVERVAALARELAPKVGADPDLAEKAARLCKADLVSEMVQEFPELQGVMGRYYALEAGEAEAVAGAIRDHYKPQGPSDAVPSDPVSIAVALADKLDTLVGFWAIDEKPTGSKDPFALRRAALGVVRIVLENDINLGLLSTLEPDLFTRYIYWFDDKYAHGCSGRELSTTGKAFTGDHFSKWPAYALFCGPRSITDLTEEDIDSRLTYIRENSISYGCTLRYRSVDPDTFANQPSWLRDNGLHLASDLLAFFADRLKQYLRDKGARHDLIDAVFALGEDDLVLITKRVEALGAFLESDDGVNLLAGYKRAANILRAEEKKDGTRFAGEPDPKLFDTEAERNLHSAIVNTGKVAVAALVEEKFEDAMTALSSLRAPLDALFDQEVKINAEEAAVRTNRLLLLASMRTALHRVADFSKIEG